MRTVYLSKYTAGDGRDYADIEAENPEHATDNTAYVVLCLKVGRHMGFYDLTPQDALNIAKDLRLAAREARDKQRVYDEVMKR